MDKKLKIKKIPASPKDRKFRRRVHKQLRAEMRNKNFGATQISPFLDNKKEISRQYKNIDLDNFKIEDADLGLVNVGEILQGPSRELKQASSAGCRAYVDHCSPVGMKLFIEGPRDFNSVVENNLSTDPEAPHEISLSASLKDRTKWWVFFEVSDFYWPIFVYEYDIPAPTCDAKITWSVNFRLVCDRLYEDAEQFMIGAIPIAFSSPDGTPASWKDLSKAVLRDHPSAEFTRYINKQLETKGGSTDYHETCWSYDVPAGVASKVYFGFVLDLRCKDGKVGALAKMIIDPVNPTRPDNSINFVSWAKEITLNCYITSAICEVLGRADDCRELNLLRDFRDNYLTKRPDGKALIQEYYQRSPKLLQAIKAHPSGNEILKILYSDYLSRCIQLIENQENEAAVEMYKNMVDHLEAAVKEPA